MLLAESTRLLSLLSVLGRRLPRGTSESGGRSVPFRGQGIYSENGTRVDETSLARGREGAEEVLILLPPRPSLIELEVCDEGLAGTRARGAEDFRAPLAETPFWPSMRFNSLENEGGFHAQKRTACASHSWLRGQFRRADHNEKTSSVYGSESLSASESVALCKLVSLVRAASMTLRFH